MPVIKGHKAAFNHVFALGSLDLVANRIISSFERIRHPIELKQL